MAYVELTPLQKNSLPAKTTSLLADDGISVEVDDQSVFYRGGSLLTKGWVLGPDNATGSYTEEITVSATDDVTGEGTVTISARAIKADGTNGAAREWPIGTTIKNTYTTGIHDQIKDNFVEHATLITARATKTTAAMSVYVDSAATGTGDGTSWTDAFTTIQAAIDSLPVILEHAVTIYVREGASAYGNTTVQQIVGKGSLTIRGEYYWADTCATAESGASATKFNTVAHTDGSEIAEGDRIFINHGYGANDNYKHYVISTVKTISSTATPNVYEIELNDSADWGNLGSGCYYRIIKTEIGKLVITNTNISIVGVKTESLGGDPCVVTNSVALINCCYFSTAAGNYTGIYVTYPSNVKITRSLIATEFMGVRNLGGVVTIGGLNTSGASAVVIIAKIYGVLIYEQNGSGRIDESILTSTGTAPAIYANNGTCIALSVMITYGTSVGINAIKNALVGTNVSYPNYNKATTPLSPASSTDASYIGP